MSDIVPLFGLETEYGIVREDQEKSDPVEESMKLLQSCKMQSAFGNWAYFRERTHEDMRGFQVSRLAQDEEEDEFCAEDRKRPYSYLEMKSDRVLVNGARFYNDHTHPEYSTPECRNIFDLVAHDLAGEKIVSECVQTRNAEIGSNALQVFKNNTDYSGHSYGTHDNYLIPRRLEFDQWVHHLIPFLVTRQLFCGAGKVGSEYTDSEPFVGLQLSQRSDFIETILSIETMTQRPIINTRDEPHAVPAEYRRLHLILGDANMSPFSTALKVGMTSAILTLIGLEKIATHEELADPVGDIKLISKDKTGSISLKQKSGKTITPLEIQEFYLEQAEKNLDGEEWDWTLKEWGRAINDLRHNPEKLSDRIDWAIKDKLFSTFMQEESIEWNDPLMQSLDLEYHNLDPDRGLYHGLRQEGEVAGLPEAEEKADRAVNNAPKGTRAELRGNAVKRENDNIKNIHWTGVAFENGDTLDLTNVITVEDVEQKREFIKEQFA
jgi:hypothetical protein